MITVNRKEDLITPSGLVLGSSGSGKGMTVKWGLLSTLLKQKNELTELNIILDSSNKKFRVV